MGSSSGSTSIEAPASGSDRTITFPDATGTVDTTARAGTDINYFKRIYVCNCELHRLSRTI